MRTSSVFLSFFGLFLLASTSFAMDQSTGCGPGWYVAKKNSLVSTSTRGTTNYILSPAVFFGITSGTSNCAKHDIVKKEKQSLHFLTHNYYEIKGEAAKGSGEYLAGLGQTMGCSTEAQSKLNQEVQRNYESVFGQSVVKPMDSLNEVYKIIVGDEYLFQQCSNNIG